MGSAYLHPLIQLLFNNISLDLKCHCTYLLYNNKIEFIITRPVLVSQYESRQYSRLQKSCNMQAEKWKTTIDLLCLNREVGHAEAGKIIRFICGK